MSAGAQDLPSAPKQCGNPAVSAAIRRIMEQWKDGFNEGNPDKVAALYADDATYLTQHFATGIVHGRPAIRAYVAKGTSAHYHIDSLELLSSECTAEFAYAITRYQAINSGQSAFGVNLVVLKKMAGRWMIVAHEAAVPDPSTAIKALDVER